MRAYAVAALTCLTFSCSDSISDSESAEIADGRPVAGEARVVIVQKRWSFVRSKGTLYAQIMDPSHWVLRGKMRNIGSSAATAVEVRATILSAQDQPLLVVSGPEMSSWIRIPEFPNAETGERWKAIARDSIKSARTLTLQDFVDYLDVGAEAEFEIKLEHLPLVLASSIRAVRYPVARSRPSVRWRGGWMIESIGADDEIKEAIETDRYEVKVTCETVR